jgi:hypothetical protein
MLSRLIASWSSWWKVRHYILKVQPADDCEVISFLDRITVASPQLENGLNVNHPFARSVGLRRVLRTFTSRIFSVNLMEATTYVTTIMDNIQRKFAIK